MKIESAVISHVGKLRANNEDNYYLDGRCREELSENSASASLKAERETFVCSVCDGMGGESYGEIASKYAAKSLELFKQRGWSMQTLGDYAKEAEQEMKRHLPAGETAKMGTALVILFLKERTAYAANLGDSRLYLFRHGKLSQLSRDHTQAQLLADHGLLRQEEVRKHKGGHMLTRYLGTDAENLAEDFFLPEPIPLLADDWFLLCSDGLTDMLSEEKIQTCMAEHEKDGASRLAGILCEMALQEGGRDNITCLLVKIKKPGKDRKIPKLMELFGVGM